MNGMSSVARVEVIAIEDIAPNPHNPRRLFDEEPMKVLEESIAKLGVLVPITVYIPDPSVRTGETYVILDGERRWRCVQALGEHTVPAIIVAQPTDAENILTMFHIHNVREGWQLMPTALKLKTLMDRLHETNERKLSILTKLTISQVRRCKILLTYPKSIQNLMLAPPSERMKADFFIEMDRIRRPARQEKWNPWVERGDLTVVTLLLDKYEMRTIKAVTEFRHIAEVYRASARLDRTNQFMKQFDAFLEHPQATVYDIEVPGATFAKEAMEIKRSTRRLLSQLQGLDLADIAADEEAVEALTDLRDLIAEKLQDALLISARRDPS